MKALNFSVKLILILLVIGAISITSCKNDTSKDNTTKKEEQDTKKRNGEEFIGRWVNSDDYMCQIIKSDDLYILDFYEKDYRDIYEYERTYAYNYTDGILIGNDKIFYNSKKKCIIFDGRIYYYDEKK